MKNAKIAILVNSLDNKMMKKIKTENVLSTKQLQLFNFVINLQNKNQLEKSKLFKMFYNETYSTDKDYLLRNELRKLSKRLEQFIATDMASNEIKSNNYTTKKYFFYYLFKCKKYALLEKELLEVLKKIALNEDYQEFNNFIKIWIKLKTETFTYNIEDINKSLKTIEILFSYWKSEVVVVTKEIELFDSFLNRAKLQIDNNARFTTPLQSIDFANHENNSTYIQYLSLKEKGYRTYGEEKVSYLSKALVNLEKLKNKSLDKNKEYFALNQLIGVEYLINDKLQLAENYFLKSLQVKNKINDSLYLKGLFNFFSTEISLKKYQAVIDAFLDNIDLIKKTELYYNYTCTVSLCCILNDNLALAEEILEITPSSINVTQHIYSRLTQSILFYLANNEDLCLNELNNCYQSILYHDLKKLNEANLMFIKFFKRIINANKINLSKTEKKQRLLDIKSDASSFTSIPRQSIQSNNSLHFYWLHNILDDLLSQLA